MKNNNNINKGFRITITTNNKNNNTFPIHAYETMLSKHVILRRIASCFLFLLFGREDSCMSCLLNEGIIRCDVIHSKQVQYGTLPYNMHTQYYNFVSFIYTVLLCFSLIMEFIGKNWLCNYFLLSVSMTPIIRSVRLYHCITSTKGKYAEEECPALESDKLEAALNIQPATTTQPVDVIAVLRRKRRIIDDSMGNLLVTDITNEQKKRSPVL